MMPMLGCESKVLAICKEVLGCASPFSFPYSGNPRRSAHGWRKVSARRVNGLCWAVYLGNALGALCKWDSGKYSLVLPRFAILLSLFGCSIVFVALVMIWYHVTIVLGGCGICCPF